jgi:uncharacterized protein (TIGR03382 family)
VSRPLAMLRPLALAALAALVALAAAPGAAHATVDPNPACACNQTPAACDAGCACDLECEIDWSLDECAEPDAGCLPDAGTPDAAALEAAEAALPAVADEIEWQAEPALVRCPEGASSDGGRCVPDASLTAPGDTGGGCGATGAPPLLLGVLAVAGLVILARRRRGRADALLAAVVAVIAACSVDAGASWDQAVEEGALGDPDGFVDVLAADVGDGGDAVRFLLPHQALAAGAAQPAAQLSLARQRTEVPILRVAGACGDRLVNDAREGAELLGWARAEAGDGTAELVELAAPDGCGRVYETDPEAIERRIEEGYAVIGSLGYVWPPGLAEPPAPEDTAITADELDAAALARPAPCRITRRSPVILLYASPGKLESLRFLKDCPGEVIVGEKVESGPRGVMSTAAAHAAGGRTAFVVDRNGRKLRALLARPNGVERTAAYLRKKLRSGYDYIVFDEITAHPEFRDDSGSNRRLRKLMLRLPERSVIPYLSIDLTQWADGLDAMRSRRLLLRTLHKHSRALALEVYLHTGEVMAGAAPAAFRRAADRLAIATRGLPTTRGINRRAFITLGTSVHGGSAHLPEFSYLDRPAGDLRSLTRQVNAIRHGSRRLRAQRGIGYYFIGRDDMMPRADAPYEYDDLIRRLRAQALRFR